MSPVWVLHKQRPIVREVACEPIGSQSNSVRRALAILEFLNTSDRRRNLSEISRKLLLPKSTASVLLSTLESMGYVTRDSAERRYALTSRAYGFGLDLLQRLDLARRSRTVLETVAGALKVTAHVSVLDGEQVLFVSKVDGVQQPCSDIYPGRRTNLQCTAVGKTLLASMCEEEQRAFLGRHRTLRHTSRTIVCPDKLLEELAWVLKRGYALDNQEEELLVRCVAVPIFSGGRTVAALGITGTVSEIRPDTVEELGAYLKRMSSQIVTG
jgi:IclR family transcriptional regulator, KDG regulon repressor